MPGLTKRILLSPLLCLLVSPLVAEEAGEHRVVAVSVLNREGKAVEGLTAANFRGEFRGQPVNIHSVSWDESPRTVLMLIDASQSIAKNASTWQLTRSAAKKIGESLRPTHEVGLVIFSEKMSNQEILDGGSGSEKLETILRDIESNPRKLGVNTFLYNAIAMAAGLGLSGRPVQVLFVVSDGVDTKSAMGEEDLLHELAFRGTRVFYLLLPPSPDDSRRVDGWARRHSNDVVNVTGGGKIELGRGRSVKKDALAGLPALIESATRTYWIEVEFMQSVDKRRDWTLEVVDENGKKRKDVEVAYPRLLLPLDSKPPAN